MASSVNFNPTEAAAILVMSIAIPKNQRSYCANDVLVQGVSVFKVLSCNLDHTNALSDSTCKIFS